MFENLAPQPADPLLALIDACRAEAGGTPVLTAVKEAERLREGQPSRSCLGPEGSLAYLEPSGSSAPTRAR